MNAQRETHIAITAFAAPDWTELGRAVVSRAGWTQTQPVYAYAESVRACVLVHGPLAAHLELLGRDATQLFEGRWFDATSEIRWIRGQDGGFRAWLTREEATGTRVRQRRRRCYLVGTYRSTDGRTTCSEERYPGLHLDYPTDGRPEDGDRAFVEVIEYAPIAPAEGDWPRDPDAVEAILNQPAIVAHRFARVGFGTGTGEEE